MKNSEETTSCSTENKRCLSSCMGNISFWIVLMTAVLAIPAFAIIVVKTLNPVGPGAVIVFVLSCWLCVYLGLRFLKNPRLAIPYPLERITFSKNETQTYITSIAQITKEIDAWKALYEKTSSSFMNLSKQPAWDSLNELVSILGKISESMSTKPTIDFQQLKALNGWVSSSKFAIIEAYVQALRAAYVYAKCTAADKGTDIDALYPELDKGMLVKFEQPPNNAKTFAVALLNNIKQKHPFVSAQLNHDASKSTMEPMPFFGKLVI